MPSLPTLPITVLAERSGVDIDKIKIYDGLGLLSRPRLTNGLVLYPPEEVDRVLLVRGALQLGFSVDAVRQLLNVGRKGRSGCEEIYVIAERHLAEVRRRRADLERIERLLTPMVEACPRSGPVDRCNIFAALSHPVAPCCSKPLRFGARSASRQRPKRPPERRKLPSNG